MNTVFSLAPTPLGKATLSDTPRTEDERHKQFLKTGKAAVSDEFARKLERELATANARAEKLARGDADCEFGGDPER